MPIWLVRLYHGTDPEGAKSRGTAGAQAAGAHVRNITFAQAVAEGIIPPSGEPMTGQIATAPVDAQPLAGSPGSR